MDPRTGEIYEIQNKEILKRLEDKFGMLVPLTKEQHDELMPLSKRKRKALLNGMSCICGSGKSFKKCCWRKYQKRKG